MPSPKHSLQVQGGNLEAVHLSEQPAAGGLSWKPGGLGEKGCNDQIQGVAAS